MDHEFHYSITYLIAARAGFPPEQALTIAHACQFVDDNDMIFEVDKGRPSAFRNYISQTMNILKPEVKLMRIYPVFHFLPGDPLLRSAARKDGMMHWLNCTPDSKNAQAMLGAALDTGDPYRMGIALHTYADTWAHQNFTGSYCDINGLFMEKGVTVGHAQAGHKPDQPARIWEDPRLIHGRIDNRERFLDAAEQMFLRLLRHNDPNVSDTDAAREAGQLRNDLDSDIGPRDQNNLLQGERMARYHQRAETREYGATPLPEYDADLWFDEAVNETVRGLTDRKLEVMGWDLGFMDPFNDHYTWKDPATHAQTPWHRFQVAVKEHQKETLALLAQANLSHLQLPDGTYDLPGEF